MTDLDDNPSPKRDCELFKIIAVNPLEVDFDCKDGVSCHYQIRRELFTIWMVLHYCRKTFLLHFGYFAISKNVVFQVGISNWSFGQLFVRFSLMKKIIITIVEALIPRHRDHH